MNMPMFSIIVPVYKVEKYLDACVKSVLSQSNPDFQLILVDDGSPDNCGQMCDTYAQADSRVQVVHKTNGGLSSARNAGTDVANGEYIIYLDSDDFWVDADALENIAQQLKETNADLLVFPAVRYYEDGRESTNLINCEVDRDRVIDENVSEAIQYLIENNIYRATACNKVVRRSILQDNDFRFKEGYLSEDMDWCGNLLLYVKRFDFYKNTVYAYRQQRGGSITATKSEKLLADKLYMCQKGYRQAMELQDEQKKTLLLAYYAYEYSVAMGISSGVKNRKLLKEMYALKQLLQYDICKKVKMVNKMQRFVGYGLTRRALCFFVKIKK